MGKLFAGSLYSQRRTEVVCLNFARDHFDKPEAFWTPIVWTDESRIELLATITGITVCLEGSQTFEQHCSNKYKNIF